MTYAKDVEDRSSNKDKDEDDSIKAHVTKMEKTDMI